MRVRNCVFLGVLIAIWSAGATADMQLNSGLEDDFHFTFKWPGVLHEELNNGLKQNDKIEILTNHNEKFRCSIPSYLPDEDDLNADNVKDPKLNSKELVQTSSLLESLYTRKLCSYRIESYWIYELCHGQYIKQYHETKSSGKRVIVNEFFLGYYDSTKQDPDYYKKNDDDMIPNVHWKNLGGQKVAMFAVKYTDGTPCDILSNIPRETTVFYACDEYGNDNIVGFEEVSSCVYEMIVVTKSICSHPAYKEPEKTFQTISCYPTDTISAAKPYELTELENEQILSKSDQNKVKLTDQSGSTFIVHYKTIDDDSYTNEPEEPAPVTAPPVQAGQDPLSQQQQQQNKQNAQQFQQGFNEDAQKEMINAFLSGSQCLNGGSGWWKYEVCLGRHVTQYHEDDKTKRRTNIVLGTWNLPNHIDWLTKNPNKRPLANKNDRTSASLFYSQGDFCELINKPRSVEVKLKCLKSREKFHAITLYLLEPTTCEYLLTIESAWLCQHVQSVDQNSQIPTAEPNLP